MTVCVATRCNGGASVIGASDRMLTAGDIKFEPESAKIYLMSTSIVVMTAGNASLQAEVLATTRAIVSAAIEKQPKVWWKVEAVAEVYRQSFMSAKRQRAELAILTPLGLSSADLYNGQKQLPLEAYSDLITRLRDFTLPSSMVVEAIIAGVDPDGAHVFKARNAEIANLDTVGFAAIGSGARHAESQLMSAKYSPLRLPPTALWETFLAKRRAEVAPGVGSETDMFIVGPLLGSYARIPPDWITAVCNKRYASLLASEKRVSKNAAKAVENGLLELAQKLQPSPKQETPALPPDPSVGSGGESPKEG